MLVCCGALCILFHKNCVARCAFLDGLTAFCVRATGFYRGVVVVAPGVPAVRGLVAVVVFATGFWRRGAASAAATKWGVL